TTQPPPNSPLFPYTTLFRSACAPTTIHFTDRSTIPSGNIVSWNWEFGDGTVSTQPNPSKTYSSAGYNDVSLTVTGENGCISKSNRPRLIRIINGITPEFEFTRSGSCELPVTASFINNTSGPGLLTFNWSFSGGQQSQDKNPVINFPAYGSYTVNLDVSSNFGCSGSLTREISF